jgi:hypothetical protein
VTWRDWWPMLSDRVEYSARETVCRIVGHSWEEETEWYGDQCVTVGYVCRVCHRTSGVDDPSEW